MAGAVHWLDSVVAVFGGNGKHIIAKLIRMARLFPQAKIHHLRGFNFLITPLNLLVAHKVFDGFVDTPALLMPENRARRLFLHMVEVELFADLAVIALLRFCQAIDIGFKLFFISPGSAVNTLQHFIIAVATPVGASYLGQFKCRQFAGRRHMGTATQIDKVALTVEANGLISGNAGNNLSFVFFANAFKELNRFIAVPLFTGHWKIFAG